MSVVTLIGAGQMASALTFPLFENGHEVRLVGSPLDDAVIDRLREDNYHVRYRRHLLSQNLEVRLRNGDKDTNQKT